jgi:hypothetical protein
MGIYPLAFKRVCKLGAFFCVFMEAVVVVYFMTIVVMLVPVTDFGQLT